VQGFTAKLAGTEVGVTVPQAAFSACYGGPFMAHKPSVYANLLREKMDQHKARCVLLNTGWSGGPAGSADRISIKNTRALLDAALNGDLHGDDVEYDMHPVFNLRIPRSCPDVDPAILNPRHMWKNKDAYDVAADKLRGMFRSNFEKQGFGDFGIDAVV
jgi:phosphoenolpyruvate carboxykinase (ATP)